MKMILKNLGEKDEPTYYAIVSGKESFSEKENVCCLFAADRVQEQLESEIYRGETDLYILLQNKAEYKKIKAWFDFTIKNKEEVTLAAEYTEDFVFEQYYNADAETKHDMLTVAKQRQEKYLEKQLELNNNSVPIETTTEEQTTETVTPDATTEKKNKTSEKQLAYAKKYLDKMAEIKLRMTPEVKLLIQTKAKEQNKSVNQYILEKVLTPD